MSLVEWLDWIGSLHNKEIDFGLERIAQVGEKLGLMEPDCVVVTVAGTNGKGSCVAGIEAIMLEASYKVGAFTTPFLFRYNEQIRLQGEPVSDFLLCEAFAEVAKACDQVTLTPFEFGTLAALVIFKKAKLDLWILEVGMGGRLDAVNIISADVAIIASIGIDHVEWLGDTRDKIGYEKAGIFRSHQPAIYGDFEPPLSVLQYADSLKTPLFLQGQQFNFVEEETTWRWQSAQTKLNHLPLPSLALQNMSVVLMAIELLQKKLPVQREAIDSGLKKVTLPGRIQIIPGEITRILDVSHNPAAVEFLKKYLCKNSCTGKTYAVFSMLADKDIIETIRVMEHVIDYWYVAPLATKRGASSDVLANCFRKLNLTNATFCQSIKEAEQLAMRQINFNLKNSEKNIRDRLIVFGSFHTVAEALI
jgi:dihydrofolate synthase/folylpolyglutamate synthase